MVTSGSVDLCFGNWLSLETVSTTQQANESLAHSAPHGHKGMVSQWERSARD